MSKLSIITINYNNALGLQKTISSVINQTSNDFEYIIIDGGSTDKSLDVIRSYESKLAYWISESDNGIYQAMNKGIQIAKGEYCQFLNSGDCLVNEDVIKNMLSSLTEYSIVYGNMIKILPNGSFYKDKGLKVKKPTMLTFYQGTINHSPAYIKRNLFKKYGLYDESLRIVSDWKFFLIAVGLHNELVLYRDVDVSLFDMNGISSTQISLEKVERRRVLEENLPSRIIDDYDEYWRGIDQSQRINRYKVTRLFFWFIDRCLFKWEKWRNF